MPHRNRFVTSLAAGIVAIVVASTILGWGLARWVTLFVIGLLVAVAASPRTGRRA